MPRIPALLAALLPLAVAAQQPAPESKAPPKLEKIEVQGDGLVERRESTAAKIVVNHEEITRHGDTNLLEVLKRLPGITVDSGPGGRGGVVRMRGLGSGYTQILVNGEPMPPGFTLDSIAPDTIERIEIVRGATAEFSTQAMAGTINVVLRRTPTQRRRELKAGASVENGQPTVNASGQWADNAGRLSWTVPFSFVRFAFENDNYSRQVAAEPDGTVFQVYDFGRNNQGWGINANLTPKLTWTLDKGHTFSWDTFAGYNQFRGHFREVSEPILGAAPPFTDTDLRTGSNSATFRSSGQWIRRFDDGSRIDARIGATTFRFDGDSGYTADNAGGIQTLERRVESTIHDNGISSNGKYAFPLLAGHALVTGWDGAYNKRGDTRLQRDLNPSTGTRLVLDEDFETRVGRVALFAQDEWDVAPRFALYLGLRWEGIETRSEGNTYGEIVNRSHVASPIVNALWKLPGTQKDQVRAGLSRTYKAPPINDLVPRRFFAPNNTPTTPDFIGNPALKPELAWGLDFAYEHYPTGGGVLSLSAYHRRIEDIVQRQVFFEDGIYISRPTNVGTGKTIGIEVDTKGKLTQLIAGAPAIDLRGNFSVNRSKVDFIPGPHNRLDQQVPWNGTVGADYRFSPRLTVGSSFTARAGGTIRTSQSQVIYTGVSRQLETYALWRFSPAVQLRLTAQNLLAQDVLLVNRFTDAGGSLERTDIAHRYRRFAFLWEFTL